ncbi:MAG: DUF192 domain-containing protein [Candidatus Aenigmatarchaeota archaeon]
MRKHCLKNVEIANNYFKRLRGLMFRRKIDKPLVIVLEKESRINSIIHSFFVFFKFDAVFLNSKNVVVDLKEDIMPFTLFILPKKPAKFVIELKKGEIRRRNIKIGDLVIWI